MNDGKLCMLGVSSAKSIGVICRFGNETRIETEVRGQSHQTSRAQTPIAASLILSLNTYSFEILAPILEMNHTYILDLHTDVLTLPLDEENDLRSR
jgi:hypothetical protein